VVKTCDVANLLSSSVSFTRIVSAFWERRIMLIIIRIIMGKGKIKAGVVASI
jgi:hypothetical protein